MIRTIRDWLTRVPAGDPLELRTAVAVQVFCLGLAALLVLSEVLGWTTGHALDGTTRTVGAAADVLTAAIALTGVALIRRGRSRVAYALVLGGFVVTLSMSLGVRGLEYHRLFLLRVYAVLLVLPALLLGRRALWITLGVVLLAMLAGHARDLGMLGGHGPIAAIDPPLGEWGQAIAVMLLLTVVLDRFGAALSEAYAAALAREHEAGRVSAELRIAKDDLEAEMARRQNAESMLFQSQKLEAIGRLSGGVAHDFNNLLTAILGYSQLTLVSLEPGDPRRAHIEGVMNAAERGAGLTRQLLAFARRQIVEPRAISVEDRVRALEPMLRHLIGENVRLETDLTDEPGTVMLDPVQFEQVLVNLAVNARDAMPGGGTLRIVSRRSLVTPQSDPAALGLSAGEHVQLVVSDTGEGMDAVTLANAFEPFFTTKSEGKGTGLGLATCYGIVRQAGGIIRVSSAPRQGATFEILLPSTREAPAAEPPVERRRSERGDEAILVVEDDPQVRDMIAGVLRNAGHEVMTAANPEGALALLRSHRGEIELLLTDIVLPRMDGRRLSERILELRPAMAVLFMSGYSDEVIARHGVLQPGIQLLAKPFTPESLVERVRMVLDARHAPA